MNAKQHISFSIYSTILPTSAIAMAHYINISYLVSVENSLEMVVGVVVGSLLPDVDHPRSIAGHILPFHLLHKVFKWARIFRHGGITHTILVNLLIAGFGIYYQSLLVVAMAFGYWSHLYLDHITGNKLGMLYWPIMRRKKK